MDETVQEKLSGDLTEKTYADRIESVRRFERQLTDNGYLVMKFFLHISEKEQEKRMEVLEKKQILPGGSANGMYGSINIIKNVRKLIYHL